MFFANPQFAAACRILRSLHAAGHDAYLAGGCVRDLLLGREPHDYDVATSARPEVVLDLFPRTFAVGAHFGVVLVSTSGEGDSESAVEAKLCPSQEITEVATFRCDGAYSDGRRPNAVRYTLNAADDVQRRDFTINGLLLDALALVERTADFDSHTQPASEETGSSTAQSANSAACCAPDDSLLSGQGSLWAEKELRSQIIDHVGGVADIQAGIVRSIGSAERRFEEDHLRMLRGVRFAARLGFAL